MNDSSKIMFFYTVFDREQFNIREGALPPPSPTYNLPKGGVITVGFSFGVMLSIDNNYHTVIFIADDSGNQLSSTEDQRIAVDGYNISSEIKEYEKEVIALAKMDVDTNILKSGRHKATIELREGLTPNEGDDVAREVIHTLDTYFYINMENQ
ncbi:hypothetical protein [Morganella morganii]|uniref:hypothetical protein n=2 Tax=Morganella morganii TaxID=582 RepID=UPI00076B744B|nr:hypothetical protein [Morganella morganii]EBX5144931.1 hypothetical protein [Salmonella enterica subsp. enterica serovar Newport]SGC52675.1 Uncharacterised protein [Mycobacterium tuberculosis]AMG70225.1 hypothetical protein AL531_07650 [Morganella morganii]EJD6112043.1 hypothetical protein [Morganella morganii]EKU4015896.1 hypothetical protein [Morganella morganii]